MDTPKGGLFYTLRVSNILPGKATPRLSVTSKVVVHPKTIVDHASGGASKPKLLDEVRAHIQRLNYSIRTEDAYVDWVRRFVLFHDKRHPREMGAAEKNWKNLGQTELSPIPLLLSTVSSGAPLPR